jgi:hypothetical protein
MPPPQNTPPATADASYAPQPSSSYAPMPKPAQNGATGQQVAVPQTMPAVAESPTLTGPTNPNAPVGGLTGANQPGDIWAPGTGPSGKASKGGVPPSYTTGSAGLTPGSTPGAGPVGGGWAGPNGQSPAGQQQPGGAGAFQGQYDAIKAKLGDDAAQTFAVKNWGSGGQQAMQQRYGNDSAAYNACDQRARRGRRRSAGSSDGQWWGRTDSGIRSASRGLARWRRELEAQPSDVPRSAVAGAERGETVTGSE